MTTIHALVLHDPDGNAVMFNWDNIVAIVERERSGWSTARSSIRVRDGTIYDIKESVEEVQKILLSEPLRMRG